MHVPGPLTIDVQQGSGAPFVSNAKTTQVPAGHCPPAPSSKYP
jgi:hypothetical protein